MQNAFQSEKLIVHNLIYHFQQAFSKNVQKIAIEDDELSKTWSWEDLDKKSSQVGYRLRELGLGMGDRVLVQIDKSVEAVILYLAVLRIGSIFVPLNPAYKSAELLYFIEQSRPQLMVCDKADVFRELELPKTIFERTHSLPSLMSTSLEKRTYLPIEPVHSYAPACIIYTSGTTGKSKGAVLSHGNLLSNAQVLQFYWGWQNDDILLHALPIYHVHGLFVALHGALINGSKLLWLNKFDAPKVVDLFLRSSVFMGVPTMYTRLLNAKNLQPEKCTQMRLFISGSAPLLATTYEEWHQRTGHLILERYGMSETIMLTSNPYYLERNPQAKFRVAGTVGKPLPGLNLRISDDKQQALPVNSVGNIEVIGPSVFQGYWDQ
ncbi:MAG: AMP-binding protein, partial [Gammaproteobacteria bacterium]|nr:AMP-binding protein [Gammaproteobacteria bacterium]